MCEKIFACENCDVAEINAIFNGLVKNLTVCEHVVLNGEYDEIKSATGVIRYNTGISIGKVWLLRSNIDSSNGTLIKYEILQKTYTDWEESGDPDLGELTTADVFTQVAPGKDEFIRKFKLAC